MNAHVDEGTEPSEVANYVVNLLDKKAGKHITISGNSDKR